MADNGERRSARTNKGVPPPRYREQVDASAVATTGGRRSKAASFKTNTTASTKKEVELEANRKLVEVRDSLVDMESELKKAERSVQTLQRKIDSYKNGTQRGDEVDNIVSDLIRSQIEAEDKVETLKIELDAMKQKAQDKVQLIQQQREVELEKVDSDVDDLSESSSERKNKEERMNAWLKEQNLDLLKTPLNPITVDSTQSMTINTPEENGASAQQEQHQDEFKNVHLFTPLNRITVDATKSVVIMTPKGNGASAQQEQQQYELNNIHPSAAKSATTKKPIYVHQKQQKALTESYGDFSDDDSGNHEKMSPSISPPEGANDQVTMRDLVNALSQFGANTNKQPHVVMKSTVDKDLPKFGGEPADWIQFKSEFERTTSKYRIDDSENMVRLRKALLGAAKTTVQHLMVNVKNVDIIMDSLEKRFGRPSVVLNALADKARACSNVTTAKPESVIEFGIAVQALVSNVISFGEDGYLNSIELLSCLVKKLSPDLASGWLKWLAADPSRKKNLMSFSEWSSMELDIAYQMVDYKAVESEDKAERRRRRGPGAINATSGEEEVCPSCGKRNHRLEKCWNFQKKNNDEKWKIIKRERICICCLQLGHQAKDCKHNRMCGINGCVKVHHRLLHYDRRKEDGKHFHEDKHDLQDPTESKSKDSGRVQFDGNIAVITGCDGPLPIVPVKVIGPKGAVKCFALLDTAASRSLIKKELAEKIGLEGEEFEYKYGGITGGTTEREAQRVSCDITGVCRGSKVKKLRSAVTVQDIKLKSYSIDMNEIKRKWPYLKTVAAYNLNDVVPQLIVGNNNPHLILARKIVKRGDDEPVGWRCELGWAVSGDFDNEGAGSINALYGNQSISNDELHHLIKQSFTFEDFGVKVPMMKGKNLDEKRAYEILERTSRMEQGRWETGLLWREDDVTFPESEAAALRRLEYTERKMKDPVYKKAYQDKIEEYLSKGYIRKLSNEEAASRKKNTYIIPHFGHTSPNKPGKFRFILDAKAKVNGVSLNDKLLTGPDLIRSLVGVLWRFRRHAIALTGEISDMFHRVKIREEDRDSQRLLWRDGDSRRPADHYQMQVMIFGATSSPSSAIYVKNRNAEEFSKEYPHAVEVITSDFYVDDCLTGGATTKEVVELRNQLSIINAAGNFVLCKWASNSEEVLASIPDDLCADGSKCFQNKEEIHGERVLGMWWNSTEDVFQFRLGLHKVKKEILDGAIPTKREMCGLIMSLFDPIGFIAHYKIKGLIILQDIWNSGIGWDDEIQVSTFSKWKLWLSRLEELKQVKVPRCYSLSLETAEDIQMHCFVDASSEAYSSICYLRVRHDNVVTISFVSAKARVAPLKKSTIPRLELQAALMGTRLANNIQEELQLKMASRYFWSDSSTVLQWLKSRAGKLKEFVANRIGEIQESSDLHEWHWIPTKMNIADVATRFESEISFHPSSDWFQGPTFLLASPAEWNFEEQRKREKSEGVFAALTGTTEDTVHRITDQIITPNPNRFSSYWRLVCATAALQKAARYWLNYIRKKPAFPAWSMKRNKLISHVDAEDLELAEKRLFQLAQLDEFKEDIVLMKKGTLKKGKLWRLSPLIDSDGIVRVDGRIGCAKEVEEDAKSPIILPSHHRITDLLVDLEHNKNAHQGVETVLSNLRRRFWIIDARHTVKSAWIRCQACHIRKCKPATPQMSDLPPARLASRQPPFTYSGIDLFGPLEVTVGRRHEKRWGVLICCMVTRAVHLEVVHALSTDEIIMALSRFIDTRGRPALIQSDNGTNFVGAAKELREEWKHVDVERIQACGRFMQIKWNFNPPAAPHMGGVWERLIQTVKKCLMVTLQEKHPKDTTLLTVLKAVENMMNSRPLTHVSTDPSDPEPITPNHILRGGFDAGPAIPTALDSSDEFLRLQWKKGQVYADQFWDRWTRFYLPKLIRREKWQDPVPPLEKGALVFIVDNLLPRNCWVRGYVSKVFPGNGGQVRQAEVMTRDPVTLRMKAVLRPVVKLCPLGLKMEIKDHNDPQFGGQNVIG